MGSAPVDVQCPLTSSLGEFLGCWAGSAGILGYRRVSVHRLALRLPYLSDLPLTLLNLPLNFIRVSSLRPTYRQPFDRPFTYSLFR